MKNQTKTSQKSNAAHLYLLKVFLLKTFFILTIGHPESNWKVGRPILPNKHVLTP